MLVLELDEKKILLDWRLLEPSNLIQFTFDFEKACPTCEPQTLFGLQKTLAPPKDPGSKKKSHPVCFQ